MVSSVSNVHALKYRSSSYVVGLEDRVEELEALLAQVRINDSSGVPVQQL